MRLSSQASYKKTTSVKHEQMKAKYLTYLEAIRIYEICLKRFVLCETLESSNCFFVFLFFSLKTEF